VRGLDRFCGVLGMDHPEQVLCFPVGCVLEEYWRDHNDNNSCCDGNDFIFATNRISSGTNGLLDCQRFSGRKKGRKRR
jgi:hypothetical protein